MARSLASLNIVTLVYLESPLPAKNVTRQLHHVTS